MTNEIKYLDIAEFQRLGYLQEVNRTLLHPCGLALEVTVDGDGNAVALGGIHDYRDDPEGVMYADLSKNESRTKAKTVQAEWDRHAETRRVLFDGRVVQPIGDRRG